MLLDPDANVSLTPNHLSLLRGNASDFSTSFPNWTFILPKGGAKSNILLRNFGVVGLLNIRVRVRIIMLLQLRPKWLNEHENFELNDIVLLHDDDASRGSGPLGKKVEVFPDKITACDKCL